MTTEQAIKKLKSFCHNCNKFPQCVNTDRECFEALDMAIKALEQTDGDLVKENTDLVKEDVENADRKGIYGETGSQSLVKDGDLISRDYVLSKFKEQCDRCGKYKENNGVMCRCCALDDAIDYVEDAPTIISAESEEEE